MPNLDDQLELADMLRVAQRAPIEAPPDRILEPNKKKPPVPIAPRNAIPKGAVGDVPLPGLTEEMYKKLTPEQRRQLYDEVLRRRTILM